ncbi:hypothetical protein QZN01_01455 [Burkholderia cenocepacia]|uniref:hypothetical protein n=1 Tax=Burkholderia cenocepacia TaxID=95486 RepID=UPI0002343C1A|nr:hypothetical protein [Burkholderia cenocepacia]MDN7821295.1 hypothetical protein [Burkholderia cenocepacia]CDN62927.1 hypothetical protein I35_5091 [Burkholderia cenocepacia H111]HEM9003769.1 hypothetical protein [Burkholderia cenocepacia]
MLVYSSSFILAPKKGPHQIIDLIARWMGKRSGSFITANDLILGTTRKRLKDGSTVTSRASKFDPATPLVPFIFSTELSHRDDQVPGRLWTTGIGLRQATLDSPVECTFLLKTDEASARVSSPIQVTRPRIVLDVVTQCQPAGTTPGLKIKQLDEDSASAFLAEVEREDRSYPIVVVSARRDGNYLVQPERIRSLLVGIADVVQVAPIVNTFEIEKTLGKKYGAWGGAINVLSRSKVGRNGVYCDSSLYRPDRLTDLTEAGINLDSEILSAVTHQTNVPASWRHISLSVVDQAVLRDQLASAVESAKQTDGDAGYIKLLEDAMDQMTAKDLSISELRAQVQEQNERINELDASVQSLKYSLAGLSQAAAGPDDESLEVIQPLREAVGMVVTGAPTLEQSLTIIRTLFPDRVVVLDSAVSSAKESESFLYAKKGFELLWKLANNYWPAVSGGGGDAEGRKVFGQKAYAQNEANALSNDGKRRRTFEYKGQDILMEKHLKIGIKDSVAETLRVHFEWVGADNVIVIGYCGKHLDF